MLRPAPARSPGSLLLVPLLCALTLGAGQAPGAARAEPPAPAAPVTEDREIPVGIPVEVEGNALPGEWQDAAAFPFGPAGPELRMKQVGGTLLVAMATGRPWPRGGRFSLYTKPGDAAGGIAGEGALWFELEPFEHNRPHLLVRRFVPEGRSWRRVEVAAVARTGGLAVASTLEMAIPLAVLGVKGEPTPPLRWFAVQTQPGRSPAYVTLPRAFDLRSTDGSLPAAIASAEHWVVARGLRDPDGPGAVSSSAWMAMLAADTELTAKGETAHRLALELDGVWDGPAGGERPKRDEPIERDLVAALRWIGEREPLTHGDLRALAKGLRALNRGVEATSLMEAATLVREGAGDPEDFVLLGRLAAESERYELTARAFEGAARLLPPQARPTQLASAAKARAIGERFSREQGLRAEEAAKDDLPLARLRTSRGEVLLRLLEDDVPQAVAQFVHLAEATKAPDGKPFFAGTLFHRVAAAGIVQGGDPTSRTLGCDAAGGGGSPWWIAPESNARHRYFRGAVGFAIDAQQRVRSQFFVMTAPKDDLHLSGFPLFATVVSGMDVVDHLQACDVLIDVEILRKRPHPYVPKKQD